MMKYAHGHAADLEPMHNEGIVTQRRATDPWRKI